MTDNFEYKSDKSNNNELKILNLRWNELRNLNVSNLIELEVLNFRDNHISEIDLSSNSNLEYLYAFGNNLSAVDLSNNNSLGLVYLNKHGWKVGYSELYDEISNNSIQNITDQLNIVLEKMIIKRPEQWIWSHNRWK